MRCSSSRLLACWHKEKGEDKNTDRKCSGSSTTRNLFPLRSTKRYVSLPFTCQVLIPFLAKSSLEAVLGVEGTLEPTCKVATDLLAKDSDWRQGRLGIGTEESEPAMARRNVRYFIEVDCGKNLHWKEGVDLVSDVIDHTKHPSYNTSNMAQSQQ